MEKEKELSLNDLNGTGSTEQSLEEIMKVQEATPVEQAPIDEAKHDDVPTETSEDENLSKNEKLLKETGISYEDIANDSITPGHIMKNLAGFTKEFEQEVEEKVQQAEKEKEIKAEQERLEKIRLEKMEQTKFEDEVVEEKEEEKESENKAPAEDLTSVKIVKPKSTTDAFNKILDRRKKRSITTSVPLANSGYIAHMAGLSSPEIRDLSIAMRTRDQYSYWDYLYQIIHEKMETCSIGNMDYDTFLKSTALSELDILLYGIFCSSFPEQNQFPMECTNPKCKHSWDFTYKNSDYLYIDENDKSKAAESVRKLIVDQTISSEEMFNNSNTNTLIRVKLKNSGMIVQLRHPTLYNQLHDVIKQITEQDVENASEVTLNRMPYVDSILVPVDEEDPSQGYYSFDELFKKISLLTDLDEEDDAKLETEISEGILEKYPVSFRMKGIVCPMCGKKHDDQAVDFRQLLFMIHRIRSVSNK